ncbi:MAG TPA: GlsB/YeaQ/YmgE family stress response membrane protein [Roseiflexaceae bacterium]|nr:GlsB/YeaQ/YmgE family stress response membrane protein [Roseiflexaceae bacterium]
MIVINGNEFGLVELIVWAIVGAIAGALGEAIVGYSPGGLLVSIVIGLVGALIGSWLARELGLPAIITFTYGGETIELLWTILGAALLVLLVSLVRRPRRYYRRV